MALECQHRRELVSPFCAIRSLGHLITRKRQWAHTYISFHLARSSSQDWEKEKWAGTLGTLANRQREKIINRTNVEKKERNQNESKLKTKGGLILFSFVFFLSSFAIFFFFSSFVRKIRVARTVGQTARVSSPAEWLVTT